MDPVAFLEEHLNQVDEVVRSVCLRHSIYAEEAEDFCSLVRLRLIEDDYHIIRQFKGKSSIKTYLYAAINRIFIDELRKKIGRWRPSEETKKLGPIAVKLEELLVRDAVSFDEACQILMGSHPDFSRAELLDLSCKIPRRAARRAVEEGDDVLVSVSSADPQPDDLLHAKRMTEVRRRIDGVIAELTKELPADNRLILKMRFDNNLSVSEIARVLGFPRGAVDTRIAIILKTFKEGMLARGINMNDAYEVIRLADDTGERHAS